MKELIALLRNRNITISSAESITGGLFASKIVEIPHASEVYLGSVISYANSVKEGVLHIPRQTILEHGVISKEIVTLMAQATSDLIDTDLCISFSGNAGPDVLEDKPVGAIYTCIKLFDDSVVYYDELKGSRNEIREEIVQISCERIIALINKKGD